MCSRHQHGCCGRFCAFSAGEVRMRGRRRRAAGTMIRMINVHAGTFKLLQESIYTGFPGARLISAGAWPSGSSGSTRPC